jgi:thiol-disulfide isomerase/thioredoxin
MLSRPIKAKRSSKVRIQVYGKQDCGLCKSARRKINHLLERWDVGHEVEVAFMDVAGDEHAAAEGDFHDVFEIPTVLVTRNAGEVLARWDGQAPPSDELKEALSALHAEAA